MGMLRRRVAKQSLESLLGIQFQRCRRRLASPGNVREIRSAVTMIATEARIDSHRDRIDRRPQPDLASRHLIDRRRTDLWFFRMFTLHAGKKTTAGRLVSGALAVAMFGSQVADDHHVFLDRLQRRKDLRKLVE